MLTKFLTVVLIFNYTHGCGKREFLMSATNCIAGRRFFTRIDRYLESNQSSLTQPYTYPWIAKIFINHSGRSTICTGTLINDRYILTAQHCVYPPIGPHDVTISLGSEIYANQHDLKKRKYYTYYKEEAVKIILLPNFDMRKIETLSNDLALVKIEPVRYSKTIYPVKLPTFADKELPNAPLENIEWLNDHQPSFSKSSVRIIDNESCKKFGSPYNHIVNENVICTVENGINSVTPTCTGNKGAPLMIDDSRKVYNVTILAGIASWTLSTATPCVQNQAPVLYVKIYDKLPWITLNTKDAVHCRY